MKNFTTQKQRRIAEENGRKAVSCPCKGHRSGTWEESEQDKTESRSMQSALDATGVTTATPKAPWTRQTAAASCLRFLVFLLCCLLLFGPRRLALSSVLSCRLHCLHCLHRCAHRAGAHEHPSRAVLQDLFLNLLQAAAKTMQKRCNGGVHTHTNKNSSASLPPNARGRTRLHTPAHAPTSLPVRFCSNLDLGTGFPLRCVGWRRSLERGGRFRSFRRVFFSHRVHKWRGKFRISRADCGLNDGLVWHYLFFCSIALGRPGLAGRLGHLAIPLVGPQHNSESGLAKPRPRSGSKRTASRWRPGRFDENHINT